MRIGAMERRTGISARMLRYYEDQDLVVPGREANGYRSYSEDDAERLETVRDLSAAGVPTRFIRIILERQSGEVVWTSACDEILAGLVRDQIADLDAKIACLSGSREALTQFLLDTGPRPTS